jgi:hypothetical protein
MGISPSLNLLINGLTLQGLHAPQLAALLPAALPELVLVQPLHALLAAQLVVQLVSAGNLKQTP